MILSKNFILSFMEEEQLKEPLAYSIGNISPNGIVSTSNRLIRPIELSSNEYKALLYAIAVANYGEKNHQDCVITEQTYIYLYKDQLGELLGLDKKNSVNVAIDRIYKELSSRVAHFVIEEPIQEGKRKTKRVHSVVPIIRELRWEDDAKNALQIRFTSEVLPYFTRLASGNFTTYQLKHLFALNSVASINLYSHFIKNDFKYDGSGYDVEISLDALKMLIDLGEKKYDRWVDFRRYVLDKMLVEINSSTDLKLNYETVKSARAVTGIRFQVSKNNHQEPLIDVSTPVKHYLDVPFDQNEVVKILGAKFDKDLKSWFVFSDNEYIDNFRKWFVPEGCLTLSQANVIINDPMFQMDFAEMGMTLNDFKSKMRVKLMTNREFIYQHKDTINEIFGAKLV